MEGHFRDFNKDLVSAEQTLLKTREKNESIRNPLLRMIHRGVILTYRKLDVSVVRDLASDPQLKKQPGLKYD